MDKRDSLTSFSTGSQKSLALKTLMRDLKDIQAEPVEGVAAFPVDDNMFLWHCNIKGTPIRLSSNPVRSR